MALLKNHTLIALLIILAGVLISTGVIVHAQIDDPFADITYPVDELGGCENEKECMAYCDEVAHINECIAFAEEHGLLDPEEIEEAKRFVAAGGEGPGGCTSRQQCDAYCSNVEHINECLEFGEAHGLIPPEELEEAKRVASALQSGAVLPGGCTSKDQCEAYCSDPSHIDECIAFAEAAGLMPPDKLEEAKKFAAFVKAGGQTPGNCRGEEECKNYCDEEGHFNECVEFAASAGFIPPEELEMIKKTGGKGPGGCRGREECEAFCNDPVNQEACFAFAEEHGLIHEEELKHAREGFARAREGLSQSPPEVRECLRESVGTEILSKIESGEPFTPSPSLGEKMRHCFESSGPPPDELVDSIENAPPEVVSCITSKLGEDIIEKIRQEGFSAFPPEGGNVMRSCFEEFGRFGGPNGPGGFGHEGVQGGEGYNPFEESSPEVLGCLTSELGFDRYRELRDERDAAPNPDDLEALKRCFEQFDVHQPENIESFGGGFQEQEDFHQDGYPPNSSGEGDGGGFPQVGNAIPSLPPDIKGCVLDTLGHDFEERVSSGHFDPSEIEHAIRACGEEQFKSGIEGDYEGGESHPSASDFEEYGGMMPPEGYNGDSFPEDVYEDMQLDNAFVPEEYYEEEFHIEEDTQPIEEQSTEEQAQDILRSMIANAWGSFTALFMPR